MFKKFIIAFSFIFISIGYINVKASVPNGYEVVMTMSGHEWSFNPTAYDNTTVISYDNHNWIKPVMARYKVGNNTYVFLFAYGTNSIYADDSGQQYKYKNNYFGIFINGDPIATYYNLPVFNNLDDASNYSCGLTYDKNNIIGGKTPTNYNIGEENKTNAILLFDESMRPAMEIQGAFLYRDCTYFTKFYPNYTLGESDHRIFNFNISVPTKSYIDNIYSSKFNNTDYYPIFKTLIAALVNEGVSTNGLSEKLTLNITMDIDYLISSNIYSDFITMGVTQIGGKTYEDFKITDLHFTNTNSFLYEYMPNGIFDKLYDIYGNVYETMIALAYVDFNYITSYTYNPITETIYNDLYVYYPDTFTSNGIVSEHRQFGDEIPMTLDNITDNNTVISDPNDYIPNVSPTNEQIQSIYNNSIQDSYNNITNNYYYDNGLTENILDYYKGFSDGATDENIDSALGYVKGTLGSLTHIPLLLSYCFNAFFPLEIIRLFQALLIIFVVFMIIRIIKHLFTH